MSWRIADQVASAYTWTRLIGVRSALFRLLIRSGNRLGLAGPETWQIHPRKVDYPVTARLRGSSDMRVFYQIFEFEEYSILRDLTDVSLVIDLGANVGFASAYFLSCFPNARVIAVEPDERNLTICNANLKPYGDRAMTLHGAVWSERTKLNISKGVFGDGREWATQMEAPPDDSTGDIQAWDVGSLIEMAGGASVDLLKVDIERAELAVFGDTAKSWLPRVRNICIELHGIDCEKVFFKALGDFDYDLARSGELTICRNLRARSQVC